MLRLIDDASSSFENGVSFDLKKSKQHQDFYLYCLDIINDSLRVKDFLKKSYSKGYDEEEEVTKRKLPIDEDKISIVKFDRSSI